VGREARGLEQQHMARFGCSSKQCSCCCGGGAMKMRWMLLFICLLINNENRFVQTQVLEPPDINLALHRRIVATSTCGELNGVPINELYCSLGGKLFSVVSICIHIGANQYSPVNQYSYRVDDVASEDMYAELRVEKNSFVQVIDSKYHIHHHDLFTGRTTLRLLSG
jgi:hypothetical protein